MSQLIAQFKPQTRNLALGLKYTLFMEEETESVSVSPKLMAREGWDS